MGRIEAVCISEKKGTVKQDIGSCLLIKDHGLKGDAHAGSERQVSLLSYEKVEEFKERIARISKDEKEGGVRIVPGCFGENLLVSGIDLASLPVGTGFHIGDVRLELTQIGKKCHSGCEISKLTGECIMPHEGVFARVLEGGYVRCGDEINIADEGLGEEAGSGRTLLRAAVITSSDRSFRGEREDKSGPLIVELLEKEGYVITESVLLPDEEDQIYEELIRLSDEGECDIIFTTGGTGFSERDRMPEATLRAADRNAPGIAEAIRAYSMRITPKAMFSRAVSVIRKKTLIINLPGSPKAVRECLDFLLPNLEHGILILRGEADG